MGYYRRLQWYIVPTVEMSTLDFDREGMLDDFDDLQLSLQVRRIRHFPSYAYYTPTSTTSTSTT